MNRERAFNSNLEKIWEEFDSDDDDDETTVGGATGVSKPTPAIEEDTPERSLLKKSSSKTIPSPRKNVHFCQITNYGATASSDETQLDPGNIPECNPRPSPVEIFIDESGSDDEVVEQRDLNVNPQDACVDARADIDGNLLPAGNEPTPSESSIGHRLHSCVKGIYSTCCCFLPPKE